MSRPCEACRTPLDWITLRQGGSLMPVEAGSPQTYYVVPGDPTPRQIALVTNAGDVIRGRIAAADDPGAVRVDGRESHFAACPGAAQFRRVAGGRPA